MGFSQIFQLFVLLAFDILSSIPTINHENISFEMESH